MHDMSEVSVDPPPADGRTYSAIFGLPDPPAGPPFTPGYELGEDHGELIPIPDQPGNLMTAPGSDEFFEVSLHADGFDRRLLGHLFGAYPSIEMVEVDGFPAALVGGPSSAGGGYWSLWFEPAPGRAMSISVANNRATIDWIIAHARFVDEGTWDSVTGGR
jgi:hypothetical protein